MDISTEAYGSQRRRVVNQGIDFIRDHLGEPLQVNHIADHCCYSPHYFNRIFKWATGRSVYGFIKQRRLECAAFQLMKQPHLSVTRIAGDLGYSPSNFSVLFKSHYGCSPVQFRKASRGKAGRFSRIWDGIRAMQQRPPEELLQSLDRKASIETLPQRHLAYQRFQGDFRELGPAWRRFQAVVRPLVSTPRPRWYGISPDDPLICDAASFSYDFCVEIPGPGACPEHLNHRRIPGGSHLVVPFCGRPEEVYGFYSIVLGIYMPHRNLIPGRGVALESYGSTCAAPGTVAMDLCIPLLF